MASPSPRQPADLAQSALPASSRAPVARAKRWNPNASQGDRHGWIWLRPPRRDLRAGELPQSSLGALFEEFHRIADGEDGLGGVVGNLAAELLLERHDELDSIETIGTEIVDEARIIRNLVRFDPEMLH